MLAAFIAYKLFYHLCRYKVLISCSNPIQLMEQSQLSVHNRIKMLMLEDELDLGAWPLYVGMIFFY